MEKIKIAFRSGSLRMGGLERILIEILKEIDKDKYEITLFIEDDCGEENVFEKDIPKEIDYYFLKSKELIDLTKSVKEKKKNLFYKLHYNILMSYEKVVARKKMKEILKLKEGIEVLIDFDSGLAKDIHRFYNFKKITWIHNSVPKLKVRKDKIERFGKRLKNYDRIVAICDDMKTELEDIYPYLEGKITRIYNGYNFDEIIKLSLEENNMSEKEVEMLNSDYILAISRLDTLQKDYETLIKGYSLARGKGFSKNLYIIGSGPDKEKICSWIKKYQLEDSVFLLGRKKNPYVWMKNCYFFVHSSKYEGFGLVLLEAQILGKVVVSSNCPVGPREILANGRSGPLVGVGNEYELSEAFMKLMKAEELGKFLSPLKESRERFRMKKIMNDIENLIDEVISS